MTTTTIVIDHTKPAKENFKVITKALTSSNQATVYKEKTAQMSDKEYLDTLDPYEQEIAAYQLDMSDNEYAAYIKEG